MAAPLGNTNARAENRLFSSSLKRSIAQGKGKANKLRKITDKLVQEAYEGSVHAISIVADRLDGKPHQSISGPSGEPITLVERVIVVQAISNPDPNGKLIESEIVKESLTSA